jgi:hypothetical protein
MTNKQVIEAFLDGSYAQAGHLTTNGNRLTSYEYTLATWSPDDWVHINYDPMGSTLSDNRGRTYDAAHSPTTNRHRRLLEAACRRRYVPYAPL